MELLTPEMMPPGGHGSPLHRVFCCIMPAVQSNAVSIGQGHKVAAPMATNPECGFLKLLKSLDDLQPKGKGTELDLQFLKDLLKSADFQSIVKVHDKVTTPEKQQTLPAVENAAEILNSVTSDIEELSVSAPEEAQELLCILNYPHFQALLNAHDRIALKDFEPTLPDIPHEVDEDEESTVKIVRLIKGPQEPLGATIQMNEHGTIKVARIMLGGAADRSGLIQVGDEVHEVNGIQVSGKPPDEVVKILTNAVGPVTLKLVPGDLDLMHGMETKIRVKAHFNYDPCDDTFIPCPEVGLAFKEGEILQIVSQDDPLWWQARKEGDRNMRAGLIPGKALAERNTDHNKENKDVKELKTQKGGKFSPKLGKRLKRPKKITLHTQTIEECENEDLLTYEEVDKHFPRTGGIYRPIVLIGASGVGRNELRRRLMNSNITHFKSTVLYTSRAKKSSEMDGAEYVFISKAEFDKGIADKRFLEHGEYKGNLYGTSLDQIKSIINKGHVCVVCPQPQSIRILRSAEYKPYVIFIKPPSFERLKETRCTQKAKYTFDERNARVFSDEELKELIAASAKIESLYSHYFDQVIVNDDLQKATNELVLAGTRLETEPMWIPASWLR